MYRLLLLFFLCFLSTPKVSATQCSNVFPDAVQNNNINGVINFAQDAQVLNSPDNILASSKNIVDNVHLVLTCGTANCVSAKVAAESVNHNDYPSNNNNITIGYQQITRLDPGNYNNITFSTLSVLIVTPGDYVLRGNLTLDYQSKIVIEGDGEVRFFVRGDTFLAQESEINLSGEPYQLLLYSENYTNINYQTKVNGFVYTKGELVVEQGAEILGAVSGKNVQLKYASKISFFRTEPDFGDFCLGSPVTGSQLFAEWRMNEFSWSGSAGEVEDQTGNFNAQAKNGANTQRTAPAITGNPGTCGYANFDGINDHIVLPSSFENLQGSFTITAWIKPSNLEQGSRIFIDDEHNSGGYGFSLSDDGGIGKLRFYSRNVQPISVDTPTNIIKTNEWVFVAAVHNATTKTRQIYLNGVAQVLTGGRTNPTYNGSWGVDSGLASIGGELDSGETDKRFTGNIDEVRLYKKALTQSEIVVIKEEVHPCDTYLEHFKIDVIDGQGLTCEADNISIKACADTNCSLLNTDAHDVQLSINGNYHKTVTVIGSTNTSINYSREGNATISLDQPYECVNGNPSDCDITFKDTGFRFFSGTAGTVIPTQISGKPSNNITLEAVEKNPESGACQAAFINTTAIEMAATCVDPTACAGNKVAINNLTTTEDIDTLASSAALTYSSIDFDFSDDTVSSAEFIATYPDAGKIQLHARYNIPDENGDPSDNYMTGASNAFVVKPYGFYIAVKDLDGNINPKASHAGGDKFTAAGENFTTKITAVQWQSDNDDDLSDNDHAINFGHESTPETVVIDHKEFLPVEGEGVLGVLTDTDFSGFVKGVATNTTMTYDEVGIISFTATLLDNSYLGAGDIEGYEPHVGRFIPHHFQLSIDPEGSIASEGSFASVCAGIDPDMDFAYIGQVTKADENIGVLQYLEQPTILITPQTKQNDHTQNYSGVLNKLTLSGIKRFQVENSVGIFVDAPIEDAEKKGVEGTKIKLTSNYFEGDLEETDAIITYQYSEQDNFIYKHEQNSEISPFIADIHLSLASIMDSDDVKANDADDIGDTGVASDTVITLKPTGKEIRFGRAFLANSFGPETANIPQPFSVQYLNTQGQFVVNDLDTCTHYDTSKITLSNNEVGTQIISANGQLVGGETRAMLLKAVPAGNQGTVNVEYDIYDWLKYDWQWNGVEIKTFDKNPTAIATFGQFRGNDRIIYQREITN